MFVAVIQQHTELLLLQVFVHVQGRTTAVAHSQNDSGASAYDVATCEDLSAAGLHLLTDHDGVLASQFQTCDALGHQRIGTYADGYDDLVIEKSIFGIIKTHFTDILFWDEAKQTFVTSSSPHLISAGNVVLNKEDKTIKFAKQLCMEDWAYYVYRMDEENSWNRA